MCLINKFVFILSIVNPYVFSCFNEDKKKQEVVKNKNFFMKRICECFGIQEKNIVAVTSIPLNTYYSTDCIFEKKKVKAKYCIYTNIGDDEYSALIKLDEGEELVPNAEKLEDKEEIRYNCDRIINDLDEGFLVERGLLNVNKYDQLKGYYKFKSATTK